MQWVFDRHSEEPELRQAARAWARALAERGWVAPAWPAEYGGAGLTSIEQFVFGEEMAHAHAPPVGGNGVVMLGPTLIVHGSEAQRREVLPRMLTGDYVYAQGYSEPGAGSDLASLATRADRASDEYVINGQKIWTSGAHHADALFMLVRTDPSAPKHRGISFLLVPEIDTPGIEVRPLLDMTHGHYFNEVFFENVRVPVAQRVGEENRGWYVGMTLLDFERSGVAGAVAHEQNVAQLAGFLASAGGAAYRRTGGWASARAELAERWIEAGVSRQLSLRIASMQAAGLTPNQEASMGKLFSTELGQRIARVCGRWGCTGCSGATSRAPRCAATSPTSTCAWSRSRSPAAPPRSSATSSPRAASGCRAAEAGRAGYSPSAALRSPIQRTLPATGPAAR